MLIQFLFTLIAFCSLILFYIGSGKNKKIILFFIWQIIVGIAVFNSYFLKHPIYFPILMLITLTISFLIINKLDINKINNNYLLLINVLRIPVEYSLLLLYFKKKIPVEMTFLGWNYDIFIGFTALIILLYLWILEGKLPRKILISWNIIGLSFLLFIVFIAVLSSPIPIQQFGFDAPNVAVLEFPFYLLPTCIVPIVMMSHIIFIKKLYKENYLNTTQMNPKK